MNIRIRSIILSVCLVVAVFTLVACALFTGKNVKGALDVAHQACVLFVDEDDPAIVAKLCDIHEEWWPQVRDLLAAKKQAAARKEAMRQNADAGADSSSDAKKD